MVNKPSRPIPFSLKRRSQWAPFLLCLLLVATPDRPMASELKRYDIEQPAMGTKFRLTFYAADDVTARTAADLAFARIDALELICSDYIPDSELSRLNQTGDMVASAELFDVIRQSLHFSTISDGAFDITAGHYTQLWRRAKRKGELPTEAQLNRVRQLTGWKLLRLDESSRRISFTHAGMQLDLGGIAKGYAADAALAVLRAQGISSAIVSASGDLAIGEPPPDQPQGWEVRLRAFGQNGAGDPQMTLHLRDCGVSTSGDLHQFVEIAGVRYSHITDPRTGLGLTSRIAASVIAPTATASDALATAACILGAEKAMKVLPKEKGTRLCIFSLVEGKVTTAASENWPR